MYKFVRLLFLLCLTHNLWAKELISVDIISKRGVVQKEFTQDELRNQPKLLNRILITLLNTQEIEKIKPLFNIYQQLKRQDPIVVLWANALIEKDKGNFKKALALYQEILTIKGQIEPVKLQKALLHLNLKQQDSAFTLLEEIAQSNNKDLAFVAQKYLTLKKDYNKRKIDFGFSFIYGKNLNHVVPKGTKIGGWHSNQEQKSSLGINYFLEYKKNFNYDHYINQIDLSISGQNFIKFSNFDEINVKAQATFGQYFGQKNQYRFEVKPFIATEFSHKEQRGFVNYYKNYTALGVALAMSFEVNNYLSTSHRFSVEQRNFYNDNFSGYLININNNLNATFKNTNLDFGFNIKRRSAKEGYNAYRQYLLTSNITHQFMNGLGVKIGLSYAHIRFDEAQEKNYNAVVPKFYLQKQIDNRITARATFWHKKLQFLNIMPQLVFEHFTVLSSNKFKQYHNNQVLVNFNKSF